MSDENIKRLRELTEILTSSPFDDPRDKILGRYDDDNNVMGKELFSRDDISICTLSVNEGTFMLKASNAILIICEGKLFVETDKFHKKFCKGESVYINSNDKYYINALEDCQLISVNVNSIAEGEC